MDPHPFWPPPPYSSSWQWKGHVTNPTLPSRGPGKLALVVLLDQRIDPLPTLLPNFANHQFLTQQEFETCTLKFNGLITDSRGPIFDSFRTFNETDSTCNVTLLKSVLKAVDGLLNRSASEISIAQQSEIGYRIDLAIASNPSWFCQEELDDLASIGRDSLVVQTSLCVAPFGSQSFNSDPCCTSAVGTPEYTYGILCD